MKNKAHFLKDRPSKFFIDKSRCPNLIENHIHSNFSIFHTQVTAGQILCLY